MLFTFFLAGAVRSVVAVARVRFRQVFVVDVVFPSRCHNDIKSLMTGITATGRTERRSRSCT